MIFTRELIYNTFVNIHVKMNSFFCDTLPKSVDVLLFSPTRAIYTTHLIHLFTMQCKSWSYIYDVILCESLSHTHTHIKLQEIFNCWNISS